MRNKRVLLVTPELQYTGAVQSFRRICITLRNNGYLIDVWSYREGPFIAEFDTIGVRVRIVPEESIDLPFLKKETSKYNLIIANTINTFKFVAADTFVPTILYVREAHNLPVFFWKQGREEAIRQSRRLYCVSEYAQKFIARYNPSVKVVHNFVDDAYESNGFPLDKSPKKTVRFLSLGTIEKRKGYDILIDAFLSLPNELQSQCELHFAGRLWDGAKDFYPDVLQKASACENIVYHGELRDRSSIHRLISECDVVVVPSRDESCSLTALEGAMMARPLILSENVGAKYILDESSGWIVETANVEALANAFIHAIKNAESLSEMGLSARKNYLLTSTYDIYQANILAMVEENITEHSLLYMLEQKRYELVTFDVFDTLLTRKTAYPRGIFLQMQETLRSRNEYRGLPFLLKSNFSQIRQDAERFFYRSVCNAEKRDTCLAEVYQLIGRDHGLTDSQVSSLMELEIETERKCLSPIKRNIELLKRAVSLNYRVALISDMYLSGSTIHAYLLDCDPIFQRIPIYVSCEHNAKKNTGDLYEVISSIENVSYSSWIHCGDDWNADCLQANKLGIDFCRVVKPSLKDYEMRFLQTSDGAAHEMMIGALKNSRFNYEQSELYELGLSFGGPILFAYVNWVVDVAKKESIDNLLFIARDGYLLKRVADAIISAHSLPIETHYIYGSRIAWRKPFEESDKEAKGLLVRYFRQETEGLSSFALVEYMGTGITLDCLFEAVRTSSPELLDECKGCYYLYLSKRDDASLPAKRSMMRLNERFSNSMELLARAPHEQTLGYQQADNGHIAPVMENLEGRALVEYGYPDYIFGVESFTSIANTLDPDSRISTKLSESYLSYITESGEDTELADLLGGVPFVLDGKVESVSCYSPRLTKLQAEQYAKNHSVDGIWGIQLKWSLLRTFGEAKDTLVAMRRPSCKRRPTSSTSDADRKLRALKQSNSYRIGRAVTYLPRLIKRIVKRMKSKG